MVRNRIVTANPTTAASSLAGVDPAVLMAALQSGQDINQIVNGLQIEQKREAALQNGGLMKVKLNRAMPIKYSDKTGRYYALATLAGGEGISVQGGRKLTPKHMEKLGQLEVDLGMSESLAAQIEQYREQNGGNHMFELVLDGESQITQLQARFPAGHPNQRQNVFLIDPTVDCGDTRNWTADDTGHPLMKTQIRVFASAYLSATQATIAGIALPENDDEFEAMLENASKISATLQNKGLENWRKQQEALRVQESLKTPVIND